MKPSALQLGLWLVLAAPGAATVVRQVSGAISYGEAIHESGEWAVRLLVAVLAVTPLRRLFPRAGWAQWLTRRRRDLGVAVFGYAALHLAIYLVRKAPAPELIAREALDPGMALGWAAFVAFAALAATSNDASVRRMGRGWKALHRWVYAAAALTIAHWVMTAFDPLVGWIYGAVLLAVGLLRLAPRAR